MDRFKIGDKVRIKVDVYPVFWALGNHSITVIDHDKVWTITDTDGERAIIYDYDKRFGHIVFCEALESVK